MKMERAAIVFWIVALVLATSLARHPSLNAGGEDSSFMGRVFGESRLALSRGFVSRADLYYHGGVAHGDDKPCEDHDHDHDHDHGAHDQQCEKHEHAGGAGLWRWLNSQVHPDGHHHLHGKRYEKEVLPWLWAAVKSDPHNERAIMVASYWLGKRLEEYDQALRMLEAGIRENPDSYRLELERARTLMRASRPERQVYESLLRAEEKWNRRDPDATSDEDRVAGGQILKNLALLDERGGRLQKARRRYEAALPLVRARRSVAKRLAGLNRPASAPAGDQSQ